MRGKSVWANTKEIALLPDLVPIQRSKGECCPALGGGLARYSSIAQLPKNAAREKFLDFTMPRDGLTLFGARVLIPVVFPSVPDEDTPQRGQLLDEFDALHATRSSARRRTLGIEPFVKSS